MESDGCTTAATRRLEYMLACAAVHDARSSAVATVSSPTVGRNVSPPEIVSRSETLSSDRMASSVGVSSSVPDSAAALGSTLITNEPISGSGAPDSRAAPGRLMYTVSGARGA